MSDLVLGTAGHIDHGKSSLVLALTGTDPDRLAEEKQRGITIELGFAKLELPDGSSLGVVDVPGHERFVRQMIAGSTGIDIALLCIAADDGIMPQTTEHLAVLELLGIPTCVVALTKTDLAEEEWIDFVRGEVEALLADGPYANAPIVPVSSKSGAGLDDLRTALMQAAKATKRSKGSAGLREPVDRVFTIKGAGTVVTGTLWSGTAAVGDEVEILPSGKRARIRSIQVHGCAVDAASAGHRCALNLNGVTTDDVRPGDFLAAPGAVSATDRFDADLSYLGEKPLESGARVHVSHGTREVIGRVLLMGGKAKLSNKEHAYAQIRLDEPLPVSWLDRFIIRSYSPVHVVGGGVVLRAHPRRSTALPDAKRALLDALREGNAPAAAEAAFAMETLPITPESLAAKTGVSQEVAASVLEKLSKSSQTIALKSSLYAPARVVQKTRSAIENALLAFHTENPQLTGITTDALRRKVAPKATTACFDALLADAVEHGRAAAHGGEVSHPQAGAGARMIEEEAADTLAHALKEGFRAPQLLPDLFASCNIDPSLGHKAVGLLEKQGRAQRVTKDLCFDAAALAEFEQALRARLAEGAAATATELKEAMETSRKYAIPLLEYFDDQGITRRSGDTRTLNAR